MSTEAEISRLKIVTETEAEDAINGLRRLASALSFLKEAQKGNFSNLTRIATNIQTLANSIKGIDNKDVDKLERIAGAVAKLNGVKMSMTRLGKMARIGTKAAEIQERPGGTGTTIRDRGGDATTLPPEDKQEDKQAKKAEKQGQSRISTLLSSLKRVAFYRLIRSALKAITQAFQEGFQNAKEWSRINNTQLYKSFKQLSAAGLAMKNALGAALGELLISVEPLLSRLAVDIANIGNAFANMFAVLGGRTEYQKAVTDVNKLAEAQERLNRALLGFDEINKLSGNQNVSDYFTTEQTDAASAITTGALAASAVAGAVGLKGLLGGTAAGAGAAAAFPWLAAGLSVGAADIAASTALLNAALDKEKEKYGTAITPRGVSTAMLTSGKIGFGEWLKNMFTLPDHYSNVRRDVVNYSHEYWAAWDPNNATNGIGTGEDTVIEVRVTGDRGQTIATKSISAYDVLNGRVGKVYVGAVSMTR